MLWVVSILLILVARLVRRTRTGLLFSVTVVVSFLGAIVCRSRGVRFSWALVGRFVSVVCVFLIRCVNLLGLPLKWTRFVFSGCWL